MKKPVVVLLCMCFASLLFCGCGETLDSQPADPPALAVDGKADIWGTDDRLEAHETDDEQTRRFARASAMLSNRQKFIEKFDDAGRVNGYRIAHPPRSLGERLDLCSGERFAQQPTVGFCSATLVAPDLVVTSGHCIGSARASAEEARCEDVSIVFDFAYNSEGDLQFGEFEDIARDSVFACKRVEAVNFRRYPNEDWALIRLDRPVVDREPVAVMSTPPETGAQVLQIGHPTGIPQKLAPGEVTNRDDFPNSELFAGNTFTYESDLFGGNSGGGVFHLEHDALVGIPTLYSGKNYVLNDTSTCRVAGVCGENTSCELPPGGYGTYAMLDRLRSIDSPLLDELDVVEGEN